LKGDRGTAEKSALCEPRRHYVGLEHDLNKAQKMAPCGAIFLCLASALVVVTMLLDDHYLVAMTMPPAAIAEFTMLTEFGAGADTFTIAAEFAVITEFAHPMMLAVAALDDDVFGACNRRGRNGDDAKGCNRVSKFLHAVLLG
jgi:hypothetical protein